MANRVLIGDYIIDWAKTGSTSTTEGVVGQWLPDDGRRIVESADFAEVVFTVRVTGAATVALTRARLNAVRDAVQSLQGNLVVELSAGNALAEFKTSDGSYSRLEGRAEILGDGDALLLLVTMQARRDDDALRPNPNLPPGALGEFGYGYEAGPDGSGAVTGIFTFDTHAAALVYASSVRSGTSRPAWLPAKFKLHNVGYDLTEAETDEFRPVQIAVAYLALPEWAAGVANLIGIDVRQRAEAIRLDERAGLASPGYMVLLNGTATFKTEANLSFGDGDAVDVVSTALRAAADAAVDAALQEAADRLQAGGAFVQIARHYPSFDVARGVVGFEVSAITGGDNRVEMWDESITSTLTDRAVEVYDTEGGVTIMDHPMGYEWRVQQSAVVRYVGDGPAIPVPPVDPQLPGIGVAQNANWRLKRDVPHRMRREVTEDGSTVTTRRADREWLHLKAKPKPALVGQTSTLAWG
jgi:hypothetical protein